MAIINQITYKVAAERIERRLFNGWPSIAANITSNEIYLYLYEAVAAVIIQQSNLNIRVDGVRSIPEGFITTYKYSTFSKDYNTGLYYITLQAPPINLPLGYSIISPYFANNSNVSSPLILVSSYQRGYNKLLPTPNFGIYAYVEGSTMFIDTNGTDITLLGTLYVPMLSARSATGNDTDVINIPDDAMSTVFDIVIQKLTQRLQIPQDNVNDGIMAPTQKS